MVFKGKVYNTKKTITGKEFGQWTVTGNDAIVCMRLVLPYMSIKRSSKIREVLKTWRELQEKKILRESECIHGHKYEETGYYVSKGYTSKRCSECARASNRKYYQRHIDRNIHAE